MPDFRYLKAFLAAARNLNFTRAAQELQISVSALSRQIALLEASMTEDLFLRNTRTVSLTAAGRRLLVAAERFEREVSPPITALPLRIGSLESVFNFYVVDLMERYPDLFNGPIDITVGTPEELETMIAAGKLDLVFTNLKPKSSFNLTGFRLFRESVSWLGSKKDNERVIVFSAFERIYDDLSLCQANRIKINTFHGAMEMIRRNVGRALVALPEKTETGKPASKSQWIYVVVPNIQNPTAQLSKLIKHIRRTTA